MFKGGHISWPLVIQKPSSAPLLRKHQLSMVELLLSRSDPFPWLKPFTPALQPEPGHH